MAEEASGNAVLTLVDLTSYLALASILTKASEQSVTEVVDPESDEKHVCGCTDICFGGAL